MNDLNPLDVLNTRKLTRIPPHFLKMKLSERDVYNNELDDWIRSKLKGRYCIKQIPSFDENGNLKTSTYVGFEDEKEMTFFALACTKLRR